MNAIIGKNDIGKSTILEALDIFFNDGQGAVKIDKNDILVMNDKLLKEKTLYFGNLDEKSGRNITSLDDEDLIIVRKDKDYYQKRLYG